MLASASVTSLGADASPSPSCCCASPSIDTFKLKGRPLSSLPWNPSSAFFWSSSLAKSTNPKPLERPADWPNLRRTTVAVLTESPSKTEESAASSTSKERLPTKRVVLDSAPVGGPRRRGARVLGAAAPSTGAARAGGAPSSPSRRLSKSRRKVRSGKGGRKREKKITYPAAALPLRGLRARGLRVRGAAEPSSRVVPAS